MTELSFCLSLVNSVCFYFFMVYSNISFIYLQSDLNIVASFDRRGDYIYTGNSRGKVQFKQSQYSGVNSSRNELK